MTSKRSLNEIFVVILRGKFREPEIGARERERKSKSEVEEEDSERVASRRERMLTAPSSRSLIPCACSINDISGQWFPRFRR